MEERIENLKQEFKKRFNSTDGIKFFNSPGRVNIIGEHTDYNGGFVLPASIDKSILIAARARNDRILNLKSTNFPKEITCSLDELKFRPQDDWANYPKSAAWVLEKEGIKLKGMDMLFSGNIPIASGLSSSAAIEIGSIIVFVKLSEQNLEQSKIPLLGRKAENEFIGVNCGIMDQFIITFGKKDNVLFLNCKNLSYELIPFIDKKIVLIIGNTKVKRELANSKYNERVKECKEGLEILKKNISRQDIEFLSDIGLEEFEKFKEKLSQPIQKRCEHVIKENQRVKEAVKCLKEKDIKKLGELLYASHYSLKNLYEVSCFELDTLVEAASKIEGVVGGRMTGAGFGGCTINLVKEDAKQEFIEKVGDEYREKVGIIPEFYVCRIEDGAKEVPAGFSLCNSPFSKGGLRGI